MKVMIAGAGIGGLTTALALHQAGIVAEVFEQASEVRELGVGVNLQPHSVKELASLGLLPALDRLGIRARRLVYLTRHGQTVWDEPRGIKGGHDVPQLSIHRGKLQRALHQAVLEQLGPDRVHSGYRLVAFEERGEGAAAHFERRGDGARVRVEGDVLVGADGIHSALRASLYPHEGPPAWNGYMIWRGAVDWPVFADGRTVVVAGGNDAKLVVYPIHHDPREPHVRLTNWVVMARLGDGSEPPPRREDWNRPGRLDEALPFVRDTFHLDFVDAAELIRTTGHFFEFPCCDRDPLPRWSFGRATLLGDAAHPMYPTGGNGATQAILDARSLTDHLASGVPITEALATYDAERRSATAAIVLSNRRGGPERVIDLVEARAPDGFDDLDAVASHAEREAIVRGYATLVGHAQGQAARAGRPDR